MGNRRRRRRRRGAAGASQEPPQAEAQQARSLKETIDSFGGFLTIGVVVATVVIVATLIWFNRPGGSNAVGGGDFEYQGQSAPVEGRLLGNPDAPVRIVAFEDFSCSHCGDFNRDTKPLLDEEYISQGVVSMEFRHLVLLGPDSLSAHAASECAAEQNLFWPYHDVLFLRQGGAGWASTGNLKGFAREVNAVLGSEGLDLDAFDSCLESGVKEPVVRAATDEAKRLFADLGGRASTPSFFINGQPLSGARPIEEFRRVIDSLAPDGGE